MNTGQMLITLGALVLLGFVILRVNNGFLITNSVLMESKFGVLASSLATSLIEEANGKSFDSKTDTNAVYNLSDLSVIGPENGEAYPNFNDFDDFNGLVRVDSTMKSAVFRIECAVAYVNPANLEAVSNSKTWHKKITVSVTSPSMTDTIRMSSVYSYFFYR